MKKLFVLYRIIILAFIAVIFTGCINNNATNNKSTVTEIKIGVFLYTKDDTFISTLQSNLEKAARNKEISDGIKIVINSFDAKGSQTAQNEQIYKCLEQDYDVLCINLVDRTVAAPIIDKAKTNNTPIVFFNREPVKEDLERWDRVYYVGAPASESGEMQGSIIVDMYNSGKYNIDKNGDGKLQYVMLEGEQGHQDSLLRTEYAIKTITNEGIQLDKLANESANWQRSQAASKISQCINTFGDNIEIILSNNDDMALGAIDAYKAEGIEKLPVIVGVDCTEPAVEELRSGNLAGTVFGDFKGQAQSIIDLSCALALGRNPENYVDLEEGRYVMHPYIAVTMDNLYKLELK